MNLAQEALGALRDDSFHGVGYIFRTQHFRRVLCPTRREFSGYASRANHADADPMFAKIFRHAAGKPDNTPFGSTIDSAASEGIFSGQRTDVDDVTRATADHGRRHGTGNHENALEIGVENAVPIGLGFLVGRAKETDTGVVDQTVDGTQPPSSSAN